MTPAARNPARPPVRIEGKLRSIDGATLSIAIAPEDAASLSAGASVTIEVTPLDPRADADPHAAMVARLAAQNRAALRARTKAR